MLLNVFRIILQNSGQFFNDNQEFLKNLINNTKVITLMGSKPSCCESPKNSMKEIQIIYHQFSQELEKPVILPQKPVPLYMIKSLKEEDDFGLFLVMEQYERLLVKQNKRIKSTSPSHQIYTQTKGIKNKQQFNKHKGLVDFKRSKSFTNTKVSTSSESVIKSILKKKASQNKKQDKQEGSQKSVKSVHFDQVLSPKNSLKMQSLFAKKKVFLRSYL